MQVNDHAIVLESVSAKEHGNAQMLEDYRCALQYTFSQRKRKIPFTKKRHVIALSIVVSFSSGADG